MIQWTTIWTRKVDEIDFKKIESLITLALFCSYHWLAKKYFILEIKVNIIVFYS